MKSRLLPSLLFTLCVTFLFAADPAPTSAPTPAAEREARLAEMQKLAGSLTYRKGETVVGDGLAKISLPEQFRYLDAKDAGTLLTDLWGNPKDGGVLGMVVPTGFAPFEDDSWAVVISYSDEGYVKDDDAAKIDYTKLLKDMQEQAHESNAERVKEGYRAIELIGWATPPRYDATAHKLYWAKELKFGSDKENTLNYFIRVLGRRGVLELNTVAPMNQLAQVEKATPAILSMVNFQEGNRYADYNSSTDKTATYGLAALVAGGIAAKAGLFKGLWVAILAFKKVIILGLVALAGSIKKFFAWIRGRSTTSGTPPPPPAAPPAIT